MKFTVQVKPLTSNRAWQGRRFKSKEYKSYEDELLWILPKNIQPMDGPIEIRYRFFMRNHKLADWDNPIKPLQDVLVKSGIIRDDRFIYRGVGEKIPSDRDYFEVEIVPYVREDR